MASDYKSFRAVKNGHLSNRLGGRFIFSKMASNSVNAFLQVIQGETGDSQHGGGNAFVFGGDADQLGRKGILRKGDGALEADVEECGDCMKRRIVEFGPGVLVRWKLASDQSGYHNPLGMASNTTQELRGKLVG